MVVYDECRVDRVVPGVEHQGIGGKEIRIEREMSIAEAMDLGTIVAAIFFCRRPDLMNFWKEKKKEGKEVGGGKVYYGHVGYLGYLVYEDELESEVTDDEGNKEEL